MPRKTSELRLLRTRYGTVFEGNESEFQICRAGYSPSCHGDLNAGSLILLVNGLANDAAELRFVEGL
jgi:hypothetical protein